MCQSPTRSQTGATLVSFRRAIKAIWAGTMTISPTAGKNAGSPGPGRSKAISVATRAACNTRPLIRQSHSRALSVAQYVPPMASASEAGAIQSSKR